MHNIGIGATRIAEPTTPRAAETEKQCRTADGAIETVKSQTIHHYHRQTSENTCIDKYEKFIPEKNLIK